VLSHADGSPFALLVNLAGSVRNFSRQPALQKAYGFPLCVSAWGAPVSTFMPHTGSRMLVMGVQLPQGAFNGAFQLSSSPLDYVVHIRSRVRNGGWLTPLEASLHHAVLVVLTDLVAVLVTQVNFHSCDLIAKSAQGVGYRALDVARERFVPFDGVIGVDLDLHRVHCFCFFQQVHVSMQVHDWRQGSLHL
jgi:hypothetical protein